jgi:undecaprenyl-diphosphatase
VLENRVAIAERIDGAHVAAVGKRIVLPVAVLLLGMIGLGQSLAKLSGLPGWEDGINRWFAGRRGGTSDAVSMFFSIVGSTPCIIAVTAIAAFVLLRKLHSWSQPLFLCCAVTAQALVFFFTTLVIDRKRPSVPHMDDSPPTSSFPSGHTSAAVALYGGLALVLAGLVTHTWAKALCWSLVLMPVGVAVARLYRGMHHPTDVTGSFINGGICIAIMATAILWGGVVRSAART